MRDLRLRALALALVALSGCAGPGEPGGEGERCVDTVCIADPEGRDATVAWERYGLRLVTNEAKDKYSPAVDGDLIVWQQSRSNETGTRIDDVLAYSASRARLFEVAASAAVHEILPEVSSGQVVYSSNPIDGRAGRLVVWSRAEGASRPVDLDLEGNQGTADYEHPWVLFHNRGSKDADKEGLWATNLDSGELVKVYIPFPRGMRPDGSRERFIDAALTGGHVYYSLYNTALNGTDEAVLADFDIASRTTSALYRRSGEAIGTLDASGEWLAWTTYVGDAWTLRAAKRSGGGPVTVTTSDGSCCSPRVAGDWVVYRGARDLHGYRLSTGESVVLVDSDQALGIDIDFGTDGRRLVFKGLRQTQAVFENVGYALFWKDLPP